MSGTISQETNRRYEQHQKTVEELDNQFIHYNLRFLLSLPKHESILTNKDMTRGIDRGIRHAKSILHSLENGTLNGQCVTDYILREGMSIK